MQPPAVLLQQVAEPRFSGGTNGDLLSWALEMRAALRMVNSDKKAIKDWSEQEAQFEPGPKDYSTTR